MVLRRWPPGTTITRAARCASDTERFRRLRTRSRIEVVRRCDDGLPRRSGRRVDRRARSVGRGTPGRGAAGRRARDGAPRRLLRQRRAAGSAGARAATPLLRPPLGTSSRRRRQSRHGIRRRVVGVARGRTASVSLPHLAATGSRTARTAWRATVLFLPDITFLPPPFLTTGKKNARDTPPPPPARRCAADADDRVRRVPCFFGGGEAVGPAPRILSASRRSRPGPRRRPARGRPCHDDLPASALMPPPDCGGAASRSRFARRSLYSTRGSRLRCRRGLGAGLPGGGRQCFVFCGSFLELCSPASQEKQRVLGRAQASSGGRGPVFVPGHGVMMIQDQRLRSMIKIAQAHDRKLNT